MKFLTTWTILVVAVLHIVTVFKPTVAGLIDDLFNGATQLFSSEDCFHTSCVKDPTCPIGYDTISKTRSGMTNACISWDPSQTRSVSLFIDCRKNRKKNRCCKHGKGPDCFRSVCSISPHCPQGYRELDRSRGDCASYAGSSYCCRPSKLPDCFDLGCPSQICPPEYVEANRVKYRCRYGGERVSCCKPGSNNGTQVVTNPGKRVIANYSTKCCR